MQTLQQTPRKHSLIQRLCEYLEKNPEEELTRGDIATTFRADTSAMDSLRRPAVNAGRLVQARNDDDGLVWQLGGPKARTPHPFAAGEQAARAAFKARRRAALAVDLGAISIEKNVPLFVRPSRRAGWNELFRQLADIHDSFAVPNEAHSALAHAAQTYRKECAPDFRYTIRKVSETQTRIWRIA